MGSVLSSSLELAVIMRLGVLIMRELLPTKRRNDLVGALDCAEPARQELWRSADMKNHEMLYVIKQKNSKRGFDIVCSTHSTSWQGRQGAIRKPITLESEH